MKRQHTGVARAVQAGRTESPGGRVRFSEAARKAALEHVDQRYREGASLASAARELGVPYLTLRRWTADAVDAGGTFRPVSVAQVPEHSRSVVVTLASGLRIEGLYLDEIAELLRRLR